MYMENDIKMKVLKRRYLKEYGVNAEEKSIEDVLIELQQLKEKVKNLETVKSKTSPKKIILLWWEFLPYWWVFEAIIEITDFSQG